MAATFCQSTKTSAAAAADCGSQMPKDKNAPISNSQRRVKAKNSKQRGVAGGESVCSDTHSSVGRGTYRSTPQLLEKHIPYRQVGVAQEATRTLRNLDISPYNKWTFWAANSCEFQWNTGLIFTLFICHVHNSDQCINVWGHDTYSSAQWSQCQLTQLWPVHNVWGHDTYSSAQWSQCQLTQLWPVHNVWGHDTYGSAQWSQCQLTQSTGPWLLNATLGWYKVWVGW